jgi:hypothetical protein
MDQKKVPQANLAFCELNRLLFAQLIDWFSSRSAHLEDYEIISLVGPRRKSLESFLCSRRGSSSRSVLKTFPDLHLDSTMSLIAYELLVPLALNHPRVLSNRNVFVCDQVTASRI